MTIAYRRNDAMSKALSRFYAEFPTVGGPALDTVYRFAVERFDRAATDKIVIDGRFPVEGPIYAYTLLVTEAADLIRELANRKAVL